MQIRVAACQQPLHEPLSAEIKDQIRQSGVQFVCLPEHYPLPETIRTIHEAAEMFPQRKLYLEQLSNELSCVLIGGTITEQTDGGFFNTCYVFDSGAELGFYRKVNPTSREQEVGVLKGEEFKMFYAREVRLGVLICADVLNFQSFDELSSLRCQIVFIPTASPLRTGENVADKYERDRSIFLEGARKLNCPVVKTCGVGATFGHAIQGRSLIATPQEIISRVLPRQESEAKLLIANLDV